MPDQHLPQDGDLIVGYPEEWKLFTTEHKQFYEHLPALLDAINLAFNRNFVTKSKADSIVFLLGGLVVEDFDEIMIMSGNGRGFGSQKILRGMFERSVSCAYIQQNGDELAPRFLNYYPAARFKLSNSLHQAFGDDIIDKKTLEEHRQLKEEFRQDYRVACSTPDCDKVRDGISWAAPMDVVGMAMKLPNYKALLSFAYYMPMPDTHANIMAVMNRLDGKDGLTMHESLAKARSVAGPTLSMAEWLMILTLDVQTKQFPELSDKLSPMLEAVATDFKATWGPPGNDPDKGHIKP